MMVMQTVQCFGEKSKTHNLTEFEVLMYEQCCNLVGAYCKQHDTIARAQQLGIDRAMHDAQREHDKWLKKTNADENRTDREALPGDEGSDPDGAGAGVPTQ